MSLSQWNRLVNIREEEDEIIFETSQSPVDLRTGEPWSMDKLSHEILFRILRGTIDPMKIKRLARVDPEMIATKEDLTKFER